ncbi:MAG: SO_0444 family Cu/Zn efflux transporter [Planctomycetia bacterium]|nr:SO_0444 family Cu/Zn efflux transporter [Planctomycetia bacterium]
MLSFLQALFTMLTEMAPYLLFGFFVTGILHVFVPQRVYRRYLAGNNFRSVLYAALFGVPLPLCSCGVIPTAVGLRKEGASRGAAVSFLIATPQTGVDSILVTWALLGLPFAIIRPLTAFLTGIFGGTAVNYLTEPDDSRNSEVSETSETAAEPEITQKLTFAAKIIEVFRYGFIEMMQDIGKWLVVGLLVAAAITVLVPDNALAQLSAYPGLGMAVILLLAIPMYVCATGSIPIAAALMMKGFSPGAAFVMLMAGPATNVGAMLIVGKVLGRRTLLIYLSAILLGAVLTGCLIDFIFPQDWFPLANFQPEKTCCVNSVSWVKLTSAGVLAILLVNALILRFTPHKPMNKKEVHSYPHSLKEHTYNKKENASENKSENKVNNKNENEKENVMENTTENISGNISGNVREYRITGMSCNHCRMLAEKTLQNLPRMESVTVNLATGSATVQGNTPETEIFRAIEEIGFGIGK